MRFPIVPLAFVACFAASEAYAKTNKYIVPGATWYDTDGNVLSAHAGGIVKDNGTWYWFGQDEQPHATLFSGINAYSSADLKNWKYEGKALSPISGTDIDPTAVVERPKAVYNEPTKTWVLWFHSDNSTYGSLKQGFATSPNVTGPYTFQSTFGPLGGTSQDFGLFKDDDGQVYALYSNGDADAAHDDIITRLNANYTALDEVVYTFYDFDLEAPTILRTESRYYILMSHKTGYRPNNVVVFSAKNLAGPWSVQSYITPPGTRTFNSQSTMTIKFGSENHASFIYCGDEWSLGSTLYDSRYIWLPINLNDQIGALNIEWHDLFSVDAKTGKFSYPKGKAYEAEEGMVSGSAYKTLCPTCSGYEIVTGIRGDNNTITISNISGTGKPQWISLYYHNPDGLYGDNRGGTNLVLARNAIVSVNGGTPVVIYQRDSNAGIILSQPLNVTFTKGNHNTITVGGYNGGAASDLDKIVVYGNIYEEDD